MVYQCNSGGDSISKVSSRNNYLTYVMNCKMKLTSAEYAVPQMGMGDLAVACWDKFSDHNKVL